MARSSRPSNPTAVSSSKKSGKSDYAQRHSNARKNRKTKTAEVYEYAAEKTRRSNVGLDLDREEAEGAGFGGGDESRDEMRARLIGEHEDGERIDSADDEELDSDAAFEESDEDRFAGFFSKKVKKTAPKRKAGVRFADVDLNEDDDTAGGPMEQDSDEEDEDMEEGEEGDEFIDVLDILDGKGEPDNDSDTEASIKPKPQASKDVRMHDEDDEDSDIQDDDEDDDEEEAESDADSDTENQDAFSPSDDEEAVPEALEGLQSFISKLDHKSQKRKAPDADAAAPEPTERARKRRMITERNEAGVENEFRARAFDAKLNLDDLIAPLSSHSSNLTSLKKSAKALASSSTKTRTLAAPLPQRTQERLDREAAYEQTKEEVDKWKATMKRIQEAEHLSFPLQAEPIGRVSNLELAAKFKPTTELESSVDALLKSAKLREEDILHTEETMLKMNSLSVEEVAQRRGELRKMRDLMFRAEIKAKRVAKIKSKTYRKIKRKERERLGEKLDAGEGSEDEGERMKRDVERARERATLRHKNTGKWAKHMKGRENMDAGGRAAIEEMLDRGEKLRRKIAGRDSEESGGESDSDDDKSGGEGVDGIKRRAFDELEELDAEEEAEDGGKRSGVFEMKFMKDAMARQQQNTDRLVDDYAKGLGGRDTGADSDEDAALDQPDESGVLVSRTGGRMLYRPGPSLGDTSARPSQSQPSNSIPEDIPSFDIEATPVPVQSSSRITVTTSASTETNPWLTQGSDSAAKAPRRMNEIVVDKDSKTMDKSKNKLKKQAKKTEAEKAKAQTDAVVEITMDNVLTLTPDEPSASSSRSVASASKTSKVSKSAAGAPASTAANGGGDDDDSEANSEVEDQEKRLYSRGKGKGKKNAVQAFEQRELVALAFAGDNVVRDFEEAKRREIASDAPKEVDTTIPGWGSWGGSGVTRGPPKKKFIKKVAGIDPNSRSDVNKSHVIISEKRDKKAAKYLVKDLPYPYTSKAQFDRRMEQPLGVEWNTRVGFQRGTLPKVVKKMGTIIDPLEKLF